MSKAKSVSAPSVASGISMNHETEMVSIELLKPHPKNYRTHPEDQLAHLAHSIKEHGFYRNVVITTNGTILAGHGVVEAAKQIGLTHVPVVRLAIDPLSTKALKIVTGDNELSRLAGIDDRLLADILKDIKDDALGGLLGTGYDEQMLANLIFVTRPQSEIKDANAAAQWVGMPEYQSADAAAFKVIVSFRTEADRDEFGRITGIDLSSEKKESAWYPEQSNYNLTALRVAVVDA